MTRYEPHCDCLGGHVSMRPDPNGRWCRADDPHAVADDPSGIVQQMPEGTTEALKPCPFCGEAAKNFSQSQFWLGCSNPECGAELVIRRDKDEAYSAWNRRTTDADLRAEVDRLRAEKAAIGQAVQIMFETSKGEIDRLTRHLVAIAERSEEVSKAGGATNYARAALYPETDGGQDG